MIRPNAVPARLDPSSYESLRQQVQRRDGWRCQSCGTMSNLEVHHREFRSHSGADSEENLITLCAACHARRIAAEPITCPRTPERHESVPGGYSRGASRVSGAGLNYLVCWRSLRARLYGGGLGSDFRGYANQEAHYTDLKQIPLR